MARIRTSTLVFIAVPLVLLVTTVGYVVHYVSRLEQPLQASDSPGEVVGGTIHMLKHAKLDWKKVSDMQYYATLPANYSVDQMTTKGVKNAKSTIQITGGWEIDLTSPNYSPAVKICSDLGCTHITSNTQQIYATLTSSNLYWELKGDELHFHDTACDHSAGQENSSCDHLSTAAISDSTGSLGLGACSLLPIILDGHCSIKIGAALP